MMYTRDSNKRQTILIFFDEGSQFCVNRQTISVDARVGHAEVKKLSAKTQQELKAQLEALLEQTPEEQELNKLLPGVNWCGTADVARSEVEGCNHTVCK